MDLSTKLEVLGKHKRVKTFRGATEKDIVAFEKIMSFDVPESYREFLLRYGRAEVRSNDIFGLGPDVDKSTNVEEQTGDERFEGLIEIRAEHAVIMSQDGDLWCLATERMKNNECPVVFWSHDGPYLKKPKTVGKTFIDWILKYAEKGDLI